MKPKITMTTAMFQSLNMTLEVWCTNLLPQTNRQIHLSTKWQGSNKVIPTTTSVCLPSETISSSINNHSPKSWPQKVLKAHKKRVQTALKLTKTLVSKSSTGQNPQQLDETSNNKQRYCILLSLISPWCLTTICQASRYRNNLAII